MTNYILSPVIPSTKVFCLHNQNTGPKYFRHSIDKVELITTIAICGLTSCNYVVVFK
jgi:hypothetical protein